MHTEYTDSDTEDVRRREGTSEGRQTQPLYSPASLQTLPPQRSNIPTFIGVVLLLLGLVILPLSLWNSLIGTNVPLNLPDADDIRGGAVLLTIGSCFLFFAFWRRIYPLLIPGCILAGLSGGVVFAEMTNGVSVLWGLSLGFLSIMLLSRGLFGFRHQWSFWPLIPSAVLFTVGTIVAISSMPFLFPFLLVLPLLLIGLGLLLGRRRP